MKPAVRRKLLLLTAGKSIASEPLSQSDKQCSTLMVQEIQLKNGGFADVGRRTPVQ
jgi:hypothetical protein